MSGNGGKKAPCLLGLGGIVSGFFAMLAPGKVSANMSTDDYCMSCHVHTQVDADRRNLSISTARAA